MDLKQEKCQLNLLRKRLERCVYNSGRNRFPISRHPRALLWILGYNPPVNNMKFQNIGRRNDIFMIC